jgi:hypothetical protein
MARGTRTNQIGPGVLAGMVAFAIREPGPAQNIDEEMTRKKTGSVEH